VEARLERGAMKLTLPTDSAARKEIPLFSGCIAYFPAALAGVAAHSKFGNDKHNPGEELHHARGKSSDHADCVARHLVDIHDLLAAYKRAESPDATSVVDLDALAREILAEANAFAWRALAFTQDLHEKLGDAPMAPAARAPQ
jgi:hypothetical protein